MNDRTTATLQKVQGEFILTLPNLGPDIKEHVIGGHAFGDAIVFLYENHGETKETIDRLIGPIVARGWFQMAINSLEDWAYENSADLEEALSLANYIDHLSDN